MAKPVLVANWKNHPGSLDEAKSLLRDISRDSRFYKKLSLFIAPPLPYLELVSSRAGNFYKTAVQDIPLVSQGTHTGVITPDILKSFGVRLVILGHSERRALGETNAHVSLKVKIALRAGITPLVCIGELSRDEDGKHFEFLRHQLQLSLSGIKKADASKIVVAYEPVWAVGQQAKGVISPTDLTQSIIFIKKVLTDMFGRSSAERVPILYGGSVDPNNVASLMYETGVKGFLVGRVSLQAKYFRNIAESFVKK